MIRPCSPGTMAGSDENGKTGPSGDTAMLASERKTAEDRDRQEAKPVYPARPVKEINFAALRDSVMRRISKARAYLAK